MAPGSKITVTASLSPTKQPIPSVIGLSLDEAKRRIVEAGFQVGEVHYEAGSPADQVLDQEPAAGETYPPGNGINLTVAAGPPDVPATPATGPAAPTQPPAVARPSRRRLHPRKSAATMKTRKALDAKAVTEGSARASAG